MSTDFLQLLVNSSGAALVTGMFTFYLVKRDKKDTELVNSFNHTIQDYLKENLQVQKELAIKLQEFSDASREQRSVIEKLYLELFKKNKAIKHYEKRTSQTS